MDVSVGSTHPSPNNEPDGERLGPGAKPSEELTMSSANTSPSPNGRVSESWHQSWTHFRVDRRTSGHCQVTFDHPPINTITATTVGELVELIGLIEHNPELNVVVFDSANPDFYLAHYDTEHDPART